MMKPCFRIATFLILFLLLVYTFPFGSVAAGGIEKNQTAEISALVSGTMEQANIPCLSIAMIKDGQASYLSYGNGITVNENSLFQIGSVTKAYTGLGILLLKDEEMLSLDDPVNKYIPWFTTRYNGEEVELTIADLLYQTSGFTNSETAYPNAVDGMSLEEGVRVLNGSELACAPSEQYNYSNTNYNILGLVIEKVSGQSYETFMTENILKPLGLYNTYVVSQAAEETGNNIKGSRLSFFQTSSYDIPIVQGRIPAGYIISCTSDMGRWLQIQMGTIKVSEQFKRIIEESHISDMNSVVDDETMYASGWFITDDGIIYHSGGTPNYSSKVLFDSNENIAVCVLTNINASANTNYIADNILNILEDKPVTSYISDIWYVFDTIFSTITFVCILLILLVGIVMVLVLRQIYTKRRVKAKLCRKGILLRLASGSVVLLSAALIVSLPIIFASSWSVMAIWAPLSLFSGVVTFTSMSVLLMIFVIVVTKYPKRIS